MWKKTCSQVFERVVWCCATPAVGAQRCAYLCKHNQVPLFDECAVPKWVWAHGCINLAPMLKDNIWHTKRVQLVVWLACILLAVASHAFKRITSLIGKLPCFDVASTGSLAAELRYSWLSAWGWSASCAGSMAGRMPSRSAPVACSSARPP